MANPAFVYKDKERADLFTAMFSLMLKENPVAVTSWFIDLKGYFMRREHPVSAYNFSIGWHKWMTFFFLIMTYFPHDPKA